MFILCIIGITFIFTNQSSANEAVENNTIKILENIKDKTFPKYKIGTYKISKNKINIEIIGSSEYYNSVKNEVETIIKNTIKSTEIENYSIHINHSQNNQISPKMSEEHKERQDLLHEVYTNINKLLFESYPNQIDKINVSITAQKQLLIEVKTTINQKQDLTIQTMEKKIYGDLENISSKLIKEMPVKLYIYNKNKEKIN